MAFHSFFYSITVSTVVLNSVGDLWDQWENTDFQKRYLEEPGIIDILFLFKRCEKCSLTYWIVKKDYRKWPTEEWGIADSLFVISHCVNLDVACNFMPKICS